MAGVHLDNGTYVSLDTESGQLMIMLPTQASLQSQMGVDDSELDTLPIQTKFLDGDGKHPGIYTPLPIFVNPDVLPQCIPYCEDNQFCNSVGK